MSLALPPRYCLTGIGCAEAGYPAKQALSNLLSQTDKALYRAKTLGRNRVVAFNEIEKTTLVVGAGHARDGFFPDTE